MKRLGVVAGALFLGASLLASCSTKGMAFRLDESITITDPDARSTVGLPTTVRWHDDEPPAQLRVDANDPDAEYYGVFVDRAPLGPGRRIESLIGKGDSCRRTPGCPDAAFLARLKVFFTAEPELELEFLTDLRPSERGGAKDPHEVTVVRMRGDRRVGEAAFRVNFFVDRG